MEYFIQLLLEIVDKMGYVGLYIYMFLVGTFVPVPSEIVLIPNGYLSSMGEKSYLILLFCGALGSLSGALFNYHFAKFVAQKFLKKKKILGKITRFFRKHGKISVFLAPLTPGLGQYISIPAGLSRMKLSVFILFTFSANLIWVNVMLLIGYVFGKGGESHKMVVFSSLGLLAFVILASSVYIFKEIKKR